MPQASVIVVGNEKGGAGKSTIAIHTATALLHADAREPVAVEGERLDRADDMPEPAFAGELLHARHGRGLRAEFLAPVHQRVVANRKRLGGW